jgi:cupin 2 domain-containing protein
VNLFDQIPKNAEQELFTALLATDNIRIDRIVSFGQKSPDGFWYDQAENEWVLLIEGTAQIRTGDQIVDLVAGDSLNIPAGTRHRVEKTDENRRTVWLAVFYK